MSDDLHHRRLKSLPAQIIPMDSGVVLRRGATQVKIEGQGAGEVITKIFSLAKEGATLEEITLHFEECDGDSLSSVVKFLVSRNFLIPCDGSPSVSAVRHESLEVFYWHFDPSMTTIPSRIKTARLAVVGINSVASELITAVLKSEFRNIEVIDYPVLRDPEATLRWPDFPNHLVPFETWNTTENWEITQCLIVCSDVGGGDLLLELNRLCLLHKKPLLPVVLRDFSGFLGPLIIPGETACYHCLVSRENSHMADFQMRRKAEQTVPEAREIIAHHPTLYPIAANLAAFELVRFFSGCVPCSAAGTLLEINVLGMTLKRRKVLKIPRCRSCSSMNSFPSSTLYRDQSLVEEK